MTKKIITVVEDKSDIRANLKEEIELTLGGDYEVKIFANEADFAFYSNEDEFKRCIRAQIFDLAANEAEEVVSQNKFSITEYIKKSYREIRVPIIIYSAFANDLNELKGPGTVFRIEKSGRSVDALCNLLKQMHETGFLEIFSPNGILESQHPSDLHEVFTTQFRGEEIQEILGLLQTCHEDGDKCAERVKDIFQRMSLRALVSKLNSEAGENAGESLKINLLEHFYRRTNTDKIPVWTGDILEHTTTGDRLYIIRPRCDLARIDPAKKDTLTVLSCPVTPYDFADLSRGKTLKVEVVAKALGHHLALGSSFRIIPPSTFYPRGGKYPNGSRVDFSSPLAPTYAELENEYKYLVSLSDDFVNEIATRFGAHLVRPGITDINPDEAAAWLAG